MPYSIEKRGSEYCVVSDKGDAKGCHKSKKKAKKQLKALYANDPHAKK